MAVLGDGVAWRALLYAFVKFPLITAAACLGGMLVFGGTLLLTFPLSTREPGLSTGRTVALMVAVHGRLSEVVRPVESGSWMRR